MREAERIASTGGAAVQRAIGAAIIGWRFGAAPPRSDLSETGNQDHDGHAARGIRRRAGPANRLGGGPVAVPRTSSTSVSRVRAEDLMMQTSEASNMPVERTAARLRSLAAAHRQRWASLLGNG